MLEVLSKKFERNAVCGKKGAEYQILDECLGMRKVDGFSETSAVHFRIEDDQQEGKQCEESLEYDCRDDSGLAPYACDERCASYGFCESKGCPKCLGCEIHEPDVQESEVFLHHKASSDRIKQFQYAGNEEDQSGEESAEPLESQKKIFHDVLSLIRWRQQQILS